MTNLIKPKKAGIRLDKYLTEIMPEKSRTLIQKMIKKGLIKINGNEKPAHYILSEKDSISIKDEIKDKKEKNLKEKIKLDTIDKTEDYLVINKPPKILSHPTLKSKEENEPSIAEMVLEKYPQISKIGENALRPGVVHRLDKDVSGLMVLALSQKMFDHLKDQFKNRTVSKNYTALVHGVIEQEEGLINTPIGRSKTKSGRMAAHTQEQIGDKTAQTEYYVIERKNQHTLLSVSIKTGRTHQIRVHLKSIGHPIVGDQIYLIKKFKTKNLKRPFLHSTELEFSDLNNERKKYKSPIPKDLKEFLESLN